MNCKYCGKPVPQTTGKKARLYCDARCRQLDWQEQKRNVKKEIKAPPKRNPIISKDSEFLSKPLHAFDEEEKEPPITNLVTYTREEIDIMIQQGKISASEALVLYQIENIEPTRIFGEAVKQAVKKHAPERNSERLDRSLAGLPEFSDNPLTTDEPKTESGLIGYFTPAKIEYEKGKLDLIIDDEFGVLPRLGSNKAEIVPAPWWTSYIVELCKKYNTAPEYLESFIDDLRLTAMEKRIEYPKFLTDYCNEKNFTPEDLIADHKRLTAPKKKSSNWEIPKKTPIPKLEGEWKTLPPPEKEKPVKVQDLNEQAKPKGGYDRLSIKLGQTKP